MLKRGITAVFLLLIASVLIFVSCDITSEKGLDESLEIVPELQSIDGADNVIMRVTKGEDIDSYFNLEFNNIESNSTITNGSYEGWCIVYDKPIDSNGGVYNGLKLLNTFGSKSFKPLNHFVNERYALRDQYPDITWREMQVLVWSVMNDLKSFDMDSVDPSLLSRLHQDGQPLYNKDMVREILSKLKESVKDFKYEWWQDYAIVVDNGEDDQTVVTFRTQTPGGWGAPANGNNPGAYRDANFAGAFPGPDYLKIGSTYSLQLTSASAVQNFLPSGGNPVVLSENIVDPTTKLGSFAGHLVSLTLSTTFDVYDSDFSDTDVYLINMIVNKGTFEGWSVQEVLDEANLVFGGGSSSYTVQQLQTIIALINENYVDGDSIIDPDLLRLP